MALNNTLDQMDLIDIFREFLQSSRIYILFKKAKMQVSINLIRLKYQASSLSTIVQNYKSQQKAENAQTHGS